MRGDLLVGRGPLLSSAGATTEAYEYSRRDGALDALRVTASPSSFESVLSPTKGLRERGREAETAADDEQEANESFAGTWPDQRCDSTVDRSSPGEIPDQRPKHPGESFEAPDHEAKEEHDRRTLPGAPEKGDRREEQAEKIKDNRRFTREPAEPGGNSLRAPSCDRMQRRFDHRGRCRDREQREDDEARRGERVLRPPSNCRHRSREDSNGKKQRRIVARGSGSRGSRPGNSSRHPEQGARREAAHALRQRSWDEIGSNKDS